MAKGLKRLEMMLTHNEFLHDISTTINAQVLKEPHPSWGMNRMLNRMKRVRYINRLLFAEACVFPTL